MKVKSNQNPDLFKYLLQPHFLFNSLNNLYALSVTGSDKTTDAIANLSQLLEKVVSYSRYDVIPLEDEIRLIRDFIELERKWLGECAFLLDFRVKGDVETMSIPPLILYTLVENAFKHGIRRCNDQTGWITINILAKKGRIYCKIRNNCPEQVDDSQSPNALAGTGVGVEAVTRVLDSMYRNNYQMDSRKAGQVFMVDLLIDKAYAS